MLLRESAGECGAERSGAAGAVGRSPTKPPREGGGGSAPQVLRQAETGGENGRKTGGTVILRRNGGCGIIEWQKTTAPMPRGTAEWRRN